MDVEIGVVRSTLADGGNSALSCFESAAALSMLRPAMSSLTLTLPARRATKVFWFAPPISLRFPIFRRCLTISIGFYRLIDDVRPRFIETESLLSPYY